MRLHRYKALILLPFIVNVPLFLVIAMTALYSYIFTGESTWILINNTDVNQFPAFAFLALVSALTLPAYLLWTDHF